MSWRYIATRLNGDGTETHLDPEAPLRDVSFTEYRNAPTEITASINPEQLDLVDSAGLLIFQKWSTALYLEEDGEICAGGILVDDSVSGPGQEMDIMGMSGYPNGQPYAEANTWPANPPNTELDPALDAANPANTATVSPQATTKVTTNSKTGVSTTQAAQRVTPPPATLSKNPSAWASPTAAPGTKDYPKDGMEPMYGIREIWRHLQAQPGGNLGVQIDPMNTGKLIGRLVAQGEFDTENGPLAFEYEPFLLRWFETFDLGDVINSLCEGLPLEFREEHTWNASRDAIRHFIRFGHPTLGSRRQDVSFVIGENVDPVNIDPPGDEYASHIYGLGAGDGPNMVRGEASRAGETRIRRAMVFENKAARTRAAIAASAKAELAAHIGVDEVTAVVARPEAVAELQVIKPGDVIYLYGEQAHRDVDMWVRVESKTRTPDTNGLEFGVQRVDRLA